MYTIATKPQSIFRILADSFRLYRISFPKIWYWQLLFFLPSALISVLGNFLQFQQTITTFAAVGASGLIAALIMTFGQCFLFNRINDLALHKDLPVTLSLRAAVRKMFPALAGLILIFIVGVIVFLILTAPLEILAKHHWMILKQPWVTLAIGGILTIFLIIIPQLFFVPLLMFENLSVFKAFTKGFRLVWGGWWRTFCLLLLLALLIAIIILLMGLVNYMILSELDSGPIILNWVGVFESLLLNILAIPFFYCLIIVQYYDLDLRNLRKDKAL